MTNRTAPSPLACTAIAAVLAAVSTPALAQEITLPDPAPAAAPAPPVAADPAPIVIPDLRSVPVVQAVPATPEPAAATTAATTKAAREAPRQPAQVTRAAAVAAAPLATAPAATVSAAPVAGAAVPADIAPIEPLVAAQPPALAPANDNTAAIGLGLLGLVALGGASAYAAARRRRSVNAPMVTYSDERLAAPAPVAAMPNPAWIPVVATTAASLPFDRAAATAGMAIPAGPLPTGPALAELFERMAHAAPDADNPYKGTKRRRLRVRWLMKQHEYRLRDGNADRNFDFRTFATSSDPAKPAPVSRQPVPA